MEVLGVHPEQVGQAVPVYTAHDLGGSELFPTLVRILTVEVREKDTTHCRPGGQPDLLVPRHLIHSHDIHLPPVLFLELF